MEEARVVRTHPIGPLTLAPRPPDRVRTVTFVRGGVLAGPETSPPYQPRGVSLITACRIVARSVGADITWYLQEAAIGDTPANLLGPFTIPAGTGVRFLTQAIVQELVPTMAYFVNADTTDAESITWHFDMGYA